MEHLTNIKDIEQAIKDNKVESVTVDMLEPVLENEEQFVAARAQDILFILIFFVLLTQ